MGRLNTLHAALLDGGPLRLDGVTYYLHGGRVRACRSKRGPKRSRTEGEEAAMSRFTEVRKMWRMYRRATGDLPVWRVAAREVGRTRGDTYFHSLNEGCIEAGRGVTAFGTFRFAAGSLEMPRLTSARLEGWTVTLEWETGEDRPKAGWTDRVFVGYFHETLPRTPGMVTAAEARRADGRTTVTIPDLGQAEGGRLHLYLFFGNETLERFSPSVHAEV